MYMLGRAVLAVIDFYSMLILVYVLMSWIPRRGYGFVEDVRSVLASLCEPYLGLFRRVIPPIGMIDFSPVVAIIVLELIGRLVVAIL